MFERPLKINHSDNHRVFFTSDTHFNHDKEFIYGSRGYKDRYEHNDALIAKINEVVRPQDTLIHLGDFCLNITPPEFEEILTGKPEVEYKSSETVFEPSVIVSG